MSVGVTPSGKGEVVVSQTPRPGFPVASGGDVSVALGAGPKKAVKPAPAAQPAPVFEPR
jgi:beta-lactam-binding protein with PASTA domain